MQVKLIVNGFDFTPWLKQGGLQQTEIIRQGRSVTTLDGIGVVPDVYYRVFARIDPKLFKLNDGTSDRYHVGFIAQDVEAAMLAEGLDSKDFGGFVADVDDAGNPVYMLRYTEFMPLILGYARQLEKRIAVLEGQQNG